MVYHNIKVHLTENQIKKIAHAIKNDTSVTLRIAINHNGQHHLPVTATQHKKLMSNDHEHDIELSLAQIKHIKNKNLELKRGGLLPLVALIPLIASVLGGIGGITGGIASAVTNVKNNADSARHNKAIEKQLASGLNLNPGSGLNIYPQKGNGIVHKRTENLMNPVDRIARHYKYFHGMGYPQHEIIKNKKKLMDLAQ